MYLIFFFFKKFTNFTNFNIKKILKNKIFINLNLIKIYKNIFFLFKTQIKFKFNLNIFKLNLNLMQFIFDYKIIFNDGIVLLRGLLIIFFIDILLIDDEPLWEPIEWSLVQTWLFFIFLFSWIGENLIISRFGSYTGRDKRVWFAWYKTFWLLEFWYLMTFTIIILFIIIPFYFELTYNTAFILSWWNWYTKVFFYKFISIYSLILLISYFLLINIRWLNWKKLYLFILIINIFIIYLLYINFILTFFSYFTDPLWYQKTRLIDHIQLSHEPLKWGYGSTKRDHFTYHNVSTVFWFKNDGPFAESFLLFNMFFFLYLFFLYIYWLILLRKIYSIKEISFSYTSYCISSLKQFFFLYIWIGVLVILSFIINYWKFPIEYFWIINKIDLFDIYKNLIIDYFFKILFN